MIILSKQQAMQRLKELRAIRARSITISYRMALKQHSY